MGKIFDFLLFRKKKMETTFSEESDSGIIEKFNSEQELIRNRLNAAMEYFYDEPSKENITRVFDELIYTVIYRIVFHMPMELENAQMTYKLEFFGEYGWLYVAYTNAEELCKFSTDKSATILVRKLFEKVVADKEVLGLAINPQHTAKRNAILFLRRENIEYILKYANDSIEQQPRNVQKILLQD